MTVTIYLPFLGGGWVSDDFVHLAHWQAQRPWQILTSPDAWGYFRPVPHATLVANLVTSGPAVWTFRATNLALELVVIGAAFLVARQLLTRTESAFLAALAFTLTPKAHPIAVSWVSARPELCLAACSLGAVAAWIRWHRDGRVVWAAVAGGCYLLALLSKETAALLPLVLVAVPVPSPFRRRAVVAASMAALALGVLLVRAGIGARLPLGDTYYHASRDVWRDVVNLSNYLARALPSAAALALVTVAAWWRHRSADRTIAAALRPLCPFALVWFGVFIAPVLPIAARSELYLYLPGFGLCLLAAAVFDATPIALSSRGPAAALLAFVAAFGGYQMARLTAMHRVADFSAAFARALAAEPAVSRETQALVIVPDDIETERLLSGSVSGYLGEAVRVILGRRDLTAVVAWSEPPAPKAEGLRLRCVYRKGRVILRNENAPIARRADPGGRRAARRHWRGVCVQECGPENGGTHAATATHLGTPRVLWVADRRATAGAGAAGR